MKEILAPFFGLFICLSTFAQADGKIEFESNEFKMISTLVACNDVANGLHQQYVQLKLENLTKTELSVSYIPKLWYNDTCINCKGNLEEFRQHVKLAPGEVVEGECADRTNRALNLFHSMRSPGSKRVLSKFEIADIEIR